MIENLFASMFKNPKLPPREWPADEKYCVGKYLILSSHFKVNVLITEPNHSLHADYHNEIYRRLFLYFGPGLLHVKHYLDLLFKSKFITIAKNNPESRNDLQVK